MLYYSFILLFHVTETNLPYIACMSIVLAYVLTYVLRDTKPLSQKATCIKQLHITLTRLKD